MAERVHGVTMIRGERADVLRVLERDYRYLAATHSGFLEGRLLASTVEPGVFFHVTAWRSAEEFAAAREDAEVLRILSALPDGALVMSHPCEPLLVVPGDDASGR